MAMKKILRLFSLALPLFLLQQNIFAQNDNDNKNDNQKKYEFVKNKSVNKSYNVSSSDKLKIENSFGDVNVHTWNKNEIKVDVSIEVSANTEALAQKMIDRISVADSKSGSDISFKTSMKDINNSKGEKSTMKINYEISMPASNPLHLSNEFGATVIPDFKGEVDLVSKFGSLTTGDLSNVKILSVEFGKAKIESASGGSVSIKFSSAEIGKLTGNVKLNLEFCSASKINIDNSLTGLDAKVSYSTVNFKPTGNLSASYDISTSFGSFKNRTDIKFDGGADDNDDHGPKFDHNYNGKAGSGSVPVKIKSSFGKVILGEATAEDMKDKEKNKSKTRTT
jgi:formylmethanofuran dehydrogenase subunit D